MSAAVAERPHQETVKPNSLGGKLLGAVSSLGTAAMVERGFSFLANLGAARLGGAATFGSYSLALTTANNIASYAGAGIGATAARFSGQYAHNPAGQKTLERALALVAVVSALLAAGLLFLAAPPLAGWLLHNPALAPLLRWAALAAAAMILLECLRGFLLGQNRFFPLVGLSACVGLGYVATLPLASLSGAVPMVLSFASVTLVAVIAMLVWLAAARPKGSPAAGSLASGSRAAGSPATEASLPTVQGLVGEVWKFGMVQLAGVIGLNAAGFWIASLIVRSDASMVQMGLFAAASQVRNMAGLAPGLFTQTSFGLLADASHEADRVVGVSSCAAALASVVLAGVGIAVLPWAMPLAYGKAFGAGVLAGCFALATSIVHLSNGPAAARLTLVSLPRTTAINTVWALAVAGFGSLLFSWHGAFSSSAAALAMAIFLAAHLLSAVLVVWALGQQGAFAPGMRGLLSIPSLGALVLAGFACVREAAADTVVRGALSVAMLAVTGLLAYAISRQGSRYGWAPQVSASLFASFFPWRRSR